MFSVSTPSFRSSQWLKLCIASVADQANVQAEHIVQDSVSDDGTLDWLPADRRVRAFIEKDRGMYDAVNRGWKRSTGSILSYLNADEQYLPGALETVGAFFESHPQVDLVFGNVVMIGVDGSYLFHRKMLPPLLYHTQVCHLETLTCAMFVRREAVEKHDLYFDPGFRDVGDGDWVIRALKLGLKTAVIPRFLSAFTMTGENMSARPNARKESASLAAAAPAWVRRSALLWKLVHRFRKFANGIYQQEPFSYSIYTMKSPNARVAFSADKPTFRWRF